MTRNLIRDGYNRQGKIKPVPGVHEGLQFAYRLILPEDVEHLDAVIGKANPKVWIEELSKCIAQHLVSWSECDDSGKPIKPSPDLIRRLPYPLFLRVWNILTGRSAPDDADDATRAAMTEALETGQTVGEILRGGDEKN